MKHNTKKEDGRSSQDSAHGAAREVSGKAVASVSDSPGIWCDVADILDALPFYVMLIDEHHHILQANSAVRAQLHVEPKDIVGRYCPTVIHGLDKPIEACPLEEAVKTNQAVERDVVDPGNWTLEQVGGLPD